MIEIAIKYALKNAYDYGKAEMKFVIPKVFGELKRKGESFDKKEVINAVKEAVEKVNKMSKEEIEEKLKEYEFEKRKEREKLIEFEGAKTRFAPEPSGYMHIGHAKAAFLSYTVAKENEGEFILRFDDTNAKNEKQEYVDAIKEDLEWLGIEWDKESYTSDNIELFYEKAKEMLNKGYFYVATESNEEIRESRMKKKPLKSRNNSIEKNLELFEKMLENEFEEGEAVVLYKGNLSSENTTLRDPTMMRIIKEEHYRQGSKYIVWPNYDFSAPIMDSLEVSHAMRSKEYELREKLYFEILEKLGMKKPVLIHFSRLKVKGGIVSKRKITPLVKEGVVWGWDDPRLLTIKGLKRRGIQKEAIKNFVLRFGIGKQEKVVDLEFLYKENRKVLDKKAKRLMFVKNPVKVKIDFEGEVELSFHPSENLGKKKAFVENEVFVEKEDFENFENVMLKGIGSFNLKTGKRVEKAEKTIHWVSAKEGEEAELITPLSLVDENEKINKESLKVEKGFVEKAIESISKGEVVQLERIGFARLDDKEKRRFIFSS